MTSEIVSNNRTPVVAAARFILGGVSDLRVILVRPKAAENVGSAARAMKNFGAQSLYLVAPRCEVGARAYALASHAGDVLDRHTVCDSLADAVAGCKLVLGTTARPRQYDRRVYTPRQAANTLHAEGVALVFGPEDFGLSNDDLAHCQGYIQIPTGDYASLNLAQAVQLVVYEWFIARHTPEESGGAQGAVIAPDLADAAPREQLERMYDQLIDTLHTIGYTDPQREASAERLFRGIFDRAALSEREVAALRGLWSQTVWAAKQSPDTLRRKFGSERFGKD